MPTSKTWTATDIQQGKLTLIRDGSIIRLERRYHFLDSGGQVIEAIAGGRVIEDIPTANIPQDILSALQEIDNWTKDKALIQEGMN